MLHLGQWSNRGYIEQIELAVVRNPFPTNAPPLDQKNRRKMAQYLAYGVSALGRLTPPKARDLWRRGALRKRPRI